MTPGNTAGVFRNPSCDRIAVWIAGLSFDPAVHRGGVHGVHRGHRMKKNPAFF